MKNIRLNLDKRSYSIYVGYDMSKLGGFLKKINVSRRLLVVSNPKITELYFKKLKRGLAIAGFDVSLCNIPEGEKYKTLETAARIYKCALKCSLDRNSVIIALGGGVVGDIAGFAAATYLRGIAYVQVPTTLLGMVDSSVGGKTGVDLKEGKNLVGAFYQPKLVLIDIKTLKSLPKRHLVNGMAEVVKYGVIKDGRFFNILKNIVSGGKIISGKNLEQIIHRCCLIKAGVVKEDEREEKNIREILNFGHTFAHAIETLTGYKKYLHGEALSIGMVMASKLSLKRGLISEKDYLVIKGLLRSAGLPVKLKDKISKEKMISVMKRDKKVKFGTLRFVLPVKIGKVKVFSDVSIKELKEVLK